MANEITIHINADAKQAETTIKGLDDLFEEHRRKIGIAMTAAGAAILGVAALSIKAAQEQAIGINILNQALERVGTSYANERDAIEASIAVMMRKTNFSDEAQREALARLITLTGSYQKSLTALPVVIDMAAALQLDLQTASLLVAKALEGNTAMLTRYGVVIKDGATATEIMATLTAKFGGSAEAAANPVIQLRNQLDELMEVVGDNLLPILNEILPIITDFARTIGEWAQEHPLLTKVIVGTTVVLGGLMAILGPLLLMLPGLIIAWTALAGAMSLVGGPVAVAAFIAGVAAITLIIVELKDALGDTGTELEKINEQIMTTPAGTSAWYELVKQRRDLMIATGALIPVENTLADTQANLTKRMNETWEMINRVNAALVEEASALLEMDRLEKMLGITNKDFLDNATKLAQRLGIDMSSAMELLARASIPELQGKVNEIVRNFIDLGTEIQTVAASTDELTDVYLILGYRLQAMGRPMEDLLGPAEKLAAIMFGATYSTDELAQALDILARVKLDELDAELQKIIRDLLGLQQEAKLTAMFGGSKLAPSGYAEALKLAQSVGRPEWAMQAFGVLKATSEEQEWARQALEKLSISQKAVALAHEEDLADSLRAEVARIRAGGMPGFQTLSPEEIARNQAGWLGAMWRLQGPTMMEDFNKGLQEIFANTGDTYKGVPIPTFAAGGVIPGPIGQPRLIQAHGGEVVSPNGVGFTFNFYGPVFGDEERIAQIFRDLARRGGFAGVME